MSCRCSQCKNESAKIKTQLTQRKQSRYHRGAPAEFAYFESLLQGVGNKVHSRFCGLPEELQIKIFKYAATSDGPAPAFNRKGRRRNRFLLLGAVCHRWRTIAWQNPTLWRTLRVYIFQRDPRLVAQLVQEWVERTQPLENLDVELYSFGREDEPRGFDKNVAALVTVINGFSHRWRSLFLEIPFHYAEQVAPTPAPPTLSCVKIAQTDFEMEPPAEAGPLWNRQQNLMTQVIGRYLPIGLPSIKVFDFSMLLNDAGLGQGVYFVFKAQNLQVFFLDGIQYNRALRWTHPDLTLELMSKPVTRPSLRMLKLTGIPSGFVTDFLEWAKFPNLHHLTIGQADLTASRTYQSFLSQCPLLTILHLGVGYNLDNYRHVHDDMLVNALAATPGVRNLYLSFAYFCPMPGFPEPAIYDRLLYRLTREVNIERGERPLLPLLDVLDLHYYDNPNVPWACIPMLFHPPQNRPAPYKRGDPKFLPFNRPLGVVAIHIFFSAAAPVPEIELQTLQQLSYIARNRGGYFDFKAFVGNPPQSHDILKASAAAHRLTWHGYLHACGA